jgi:hypothetical protein
MREIADGMFPVIRHCSEEGEVAFRELNRYSR